MTTTFSDFGISIRPGASGNVKVLCPRCSSDRRHTTDPCLSVEVNEGLWLCHNCGWAGGLGDKPEPKWIPVEVKHETPNEKVLRWLWDSRRISKPVLERNRVEMVRRTIEGVERAAVMFGYYADGVLVNAKFRTSDKKFSQTPGGMAVPYKMDDLVGKTECIVTEGELDALSFEEAGFQNAVSVPGGAVGATDKAVNGKLKFLELWPWIFDGMERIYLALDADDPGIRTRDELARRFGAERCWTVSYPAGCKDANDVLVKHGASALAECVVNATPFPIDGVLSVDDLTEGFWEMRRHGLHGGAGIFLGDLDTYITWSTPALTIVTGAPNSGKSPFFDMISVMLMVQHDWRVAFFTPENFPTEVHLARLVEQVIGISTSKRFTDCMTDAEASAGLAFLRERVHYIQPTSDAYTVEMVLEKADFLVRRYGVKMVIIDPWNFFEHQYGSDSETLYTSKCLNRMRTFARKVGVHLVVVAHPRKLQKNKDGTWPFATMYDISGSAAWYSMADFGLSVERVRAGGVEVHTIVHVLKVKHSHMGMLGESYLSFDSVNKRYRGATEAVDRRPMIPIPTSKGSIGRTVSQPAAPKQLSAPPPTDTEPWNTYTDDEQPF